MKYYILEIENIAVDLSSKRLVLNTSLQSAEIQQLIKQTFDINIVLLKTSKRFSSNQLLPNQPFLYMIGSIDSLLSYDDLNMDKCHLKSSITTTGHTISETGAADEFVEKLESSSILTINQVFCLISFSVS